MKLTIKDRLHIGVFLPNNGNFKEFNLKQGILKKVEISDDEKELVGLKNNEGGDRIEWDSTKDPVKDVVFSDDEKLYLKGVCEKISDQVLGDDMWRTVEKVYNDVIQ